VHASHGPWLFLADEYQARTRVTETRLTGGKGQTPPAKQAGGRDGPKLHPNTRRNAVAILAVAPLAAAISVSPAPLSNMEKLDARLVVMRRKGLVRMCVSWCPKGAAMTTEERAGVLLRALDASRIGSFTNDHASA
jgi:hypothetical protein